MRRKRPFDGSASGKKPCKSIGGGDRRVAGLTEALEQYEAATVARDEAFDDFVEAAEGANLTAYADDVAPTDYIADSIDEAEGALATVESTLAGSRAATAEEFDAGAIGATSTGTDTGLSASSVQSLADVTATGAASGVDEVFFNDDLLETGDRFSDARLESIVADAQTALNEDARNYTDTGAIVHTVTSGDLAATTGDLSGVAGIEEGDFVAGVYTSTGTAVNTATVSASSDVIAENDVFTARQLQSKLNAANSDLSGDINRKGTNLEVGAQLNTAIASYLESNADTASLNDIRTEYVEWANGVEDGDDAATLETLQGNWAAGVDLAIEAVFGVADISADGARAGVEADDAAEGIPTEIVNLLLDLNGRFEKQEAVIAREEALADTETGFDFLQASELQEDRAEQVEARDNASELVDALTGLQGDYEAAVADAADAAEALGFDVVEVEDGIIFGEADTDELFTFDTENLEELGFTSVTLEEMEAGDALFFGTEFQAGTDIEAGDNNVQEIFVTANNAGDVVLEVENTVFGSAEDDTLAVTLTGISEEQVSIDGGVVSIA